MNLFYDLGDPWEESGGSGHTLPQGFERTIIMMHYTPSSEMEQLFIRGGLNQEENPGRRINIFDS